MEIKTPVSQLFMVGPTYAKRLEKLGIKTLQDLIYHFPSRYEDFRLISKIDRVQPGEIVTIQAQIQDMKNEFTRNGKKIQKAKVSDGTRILEIIWFNQPYLVNAIKIGERFNFSGKVDWFGKTLAMVSPEYELLKFSPPTTHNNPSPLLFRTIHTGRLVPVYPETYGVSSKWLRSRISPLIDKVLPNINEFLPEKITRTHNLINIQQALGQIHFPDNFDQISQSRQRLAFDELFLIQLAALFRKGQWKKKIKGHKFKIYQKKISEFISHLPFRLTNAQKKSIQEILNDLTKDEPMNRLLEGDVGSGKTIVAACAIYSAFLNGYKSALMAPTEILANQHFQTLNQTLSQIGLKVDLLTGSRKPKNIMQADLLIGTHAIIQENIKLDNLGLTVIDEQHRFGVKQREALIKKGSCPHILTMTATPIPRTITLTLFGDLDLSVLDEMPEGRKRIKTWVVPKNKREDAYSWINKKVKDTDEQAFIICPLIDESETLQSVRAASVEFENLSKKVFADLRVGLLHGRLKSKEKDEVVNRFREGRLDILVSTPVVEVGIDIPQATIMMIEAADRFGLAALHQLRGRVGRGQKESFCFLFSENSEGKSLERLKALEKINLGMELAEIDLKMRGPGEIYGTAQHGIPNLKIASFSDLQMIQETRNAAEETISELDKYPLLQKRIELLNKEIATTN
ncbi:MAG: ATP-dependent DNA helicase RecG [bacterium]|nr:ATP-dependent DNA helicase RecG [bacterium]